MKILGADETIAILIMAHICRSGGTVRKEEIAQRNGVYARRLEPVLVKLVKAGLLASHRGPAGGYSLSRERRRINLKQVVQASQPEASPPQASPPQAQKTKLNSPLAQTVLNPLMVRLTQRTLAELEKITLEDIRSQQTATPQTADKKSSPIDFSI